MLPRLMHPRILAVLVCLLAAALVGCLARSAALEQEAATHAASVVVSPTPAESKQVAEPQALTRLDPGGLYNYEEPVWSPDSTKIAYRRYQVTAEQWYPITTTDELFILDLATRQTIQLTHNDVQDFGPVWSPDGQRLVYTTRKVVSSPPEHFRYAYSLRMINADGSGDTELFACPFTCWSPDWSPVGDRIAFDLSLTEPPADEVEYRSQSEIHLINVDGSGLVRLTHGEGTAGLPRWSPDGQRIVFERTPGLEPGNKIWIVDVQSGVETQIGPDRAWTPTWSPDGEGIVFQAPSPDHRQYILYYLSLEDESIEPLFTAKIEGLEIPRALGTPDWSPDGTKLVFSGGPVLGLYVADMSILGPR